jgi:hypothetical protein
MGEPITLVEIDIPVCSLTYGTSPCTAAVGVTGDIKCFNTLRTCQDRENFARSVFTLRLTRATPGLPIAYDALPNVQAVSLTPPQLDPGRSMGVRASVKVACGEHPTADGLMDKYVAERGYDPFARGTFWAKLRARVPSMEGYPLRILRGEIGQALADMYTEHYFVTSAVRDASGINIQAKDALSFCDAKKAQCPKPSTGRLTGDVDTTLTTFDLAPSGVGDAEYPASGVMCLSNKELITFTRSGDTVTPTARAQYGTVAQAHKTGAVAQVAQVFDAESVADIVYSLLVDFTGGVDAAWCDLPTWQAEADAYIGVLYTGVIPAPTPVATLVNELVSQAGVNIWWDPAAQQIRFRSLRPVAAGATIYDDDKLVAGTFAEKEQPEKRLSDVLTYYGVANYANKIDKEDNFQASILSVDPDADFDYDGLPAHGVNMSRWLTIDNRSGAERLNNMQLSRYRDAPRVMKFSLWRGSVDVVLPTLGDGINLSPRSVQDTTGAPAIVPALITSMDVKEDAVDYDAEELQFADSLVPSGDRSVFIDTDHFNINLRALYDTLYSSLGTNITFYLSPGAWIGSTTLSPSVTVGDFGEANVFLVIGTADNPDAEILGGGGYGGGYPGDSNGRDGSPAIYTRYPITITNLGRIGGGGGGGQKYIAIGGPSQSLCGGGGGAGFNGYTFGGARKGGAGGLPQGIAIDGGTALGSDGGSDNGHIGGDGGDLGQGGSGADGTLEVTYTAAGAAIDGISFVTFDGDPGIVIGDQIN